MLRDAAEALTTDPRIDETVPIVSDLLIEIQMGTDCEIFYSLDVNKVNSSRGQPIIIRASAPGDSKKDDQWY